MRKATEADRTIVTEILFSAFSEIRLQNSINYIVKQDDHRLRRLRFLMSYMFTIAHLFGSVYISNNNRACLLIIETNKKKFSLKKIYWDLLLVFNTIGLNRVMKIIKRQRQLNKHHSKEHHIHPLILGVKREYEGKGDGIRLIRKVERLYQNNVLPIIIETTSTENIKLYKKLGFSPFKEINSLGYPLIFLKK